MHRKSTELFNWLYLFITSASGNCYEREQIFLDSMRCYSYTVVPNSTMLCIHVTETYVFLKRWLTILRR